MTQSRAMIPPLLFEEEGFSGNHAHYDDFRNSLLNVVLNPLLVREWNAAPRCRHCLHLHYVASLTSRETI